MAEEVRQPEFIDTLKVFNNSIVTTRVYPPKAPQVATAIERSYKKIKQHLRLHGDFSVGLCNAEELLCGEVVPPEVLRSISNLIIFRQLALLGVDQFVAKPGLDRSNFKKLFRVFNAKVDEIKKEGGGREYLVQLGLDHFFPEQEKAPPASSIPSPEEPEPKGQKSPAVSHEYVDILLGKLHRPIQAKKLRTLMQDSTRGSQVFAAAVISAAEELQMKRQLAPFPVFGLLLENSDQIVHAENKEAVARATAALLVQHLRPETLAILFGQQFVTDIGASLYASLIQQMSLEHFALIIKQLRERSALLRLTASEDSPQVRFIAETLERLQQTPKGKQLVGQEKAKSLIAAGEKERQEKRIQTGLQALLQGNHSVLQNEELTGHLPSTLQTFMAEGRDEEANTLFDILREHAPNVAAEVQSHLFRSLATMSETLVLEKRWEWLQKICEPLLYWLEYADNADFVYEKIAYALQALMSHCWETSNFELGDRILSLIYRIRAGSLQKSSDVRFMVGRVQDRGIDKTVLPLLLEQCLVNPADETLSRRLILQGPVVSRFLVDALMQADDAQMRIKIIDLLTYGEQFLPPILIEKLSEPMPWYGKRNLLKLLADTGNFEHLEPVYPFLQHEDMRVQREAFICVYKISGEKRKEALLRALATAGEAMKIQIVRALVPLCDPDVARGYGQLLEDREYYSEKNRDTLMASVCQALGRCPYPESVEVLQKLLHLRGKRGGRKVGEKVWQAAEQALNQILEEQQGDKRRKAQAKQLRKAALQKTSSGKGAEERRRSITGLIEENDIQELLQKGESSQAKAKLLDLIGRVARLRRFSQAEQLREWLIEIDSMALSDIIRAAEIIEEEKQAAVDKGHLEVWSELYDVLTTEEFSTLYHALQHRRYANEEILVKKGSSLTSLFFINSGKVKLFYRDKGGDVLVKTMGRGEVLGAGTFFDVSVWTLSAASLGQVDVSILKLSRLKQWQEEFPALDSKLNDFCQKFESVEEFFRSTAKDRRQHKRHKISGRITTTLLDSKGQSTGINSRGDLFDISLGGISFFLRISKKENARLLLGRSLRLTLPLEETAGQPLAFEGVIMAVRGHHAMEAEYSAHIEFKYQLERSELSRILQLLAE